MRVFRCSAERVDGAPCGGWANATGMCPRHAGVVPHVAGGPDAVLGALESDRRRHLRQAALYLRTEERRKRAPGYRGGAAAVAGTPTSPRAANAAQGRTERQDGVTQ